LDRTMSDVTRVEFVATLEEVRVPGECITTATSTRG